MPRLPGPGESLAETHPDAAAQWHPTENGEVTPARVRSTSHFLAVFSHPCPGGDGEHTWRTEVRVLAQRGQGCPTCASRKVHTCNSLAARFPEVAAEWDDPDRDSDEVTFGSGYRAWWKHVSEAGITHRWRSSVDHRTIGSRGCPTCRGTAGIDSENTLAARFPEVAKLWDEERNGELTPTSIRPFSETEAYWRHTTPSGVTHRWKRTVKVQARNSGGYCPDCSLLGESEPEIRLWHELATVLPLAPRGTVVRLPSGRRSLPDVYSPELGIIVEYDGPWHAEAGEKDTRKTDGWEELGLHVTRLRLTGVEKLREEDFAITPRDSPKALADMVLRRLGEVGRIPADLQAEVETYLSREGEQARAAADEYILPRKEAAAVPPQWAPRSRPPSTDLLPAAAGVDRIARLQAALEHPLTQNMPPEVRTTAGILLQNPTWTLAEVGQALSPPTTARMVNHRLKRLRAVAEGRLQPPPVPRWRRALGSYITREGHSDIPPSHVEGGFALGRWAMAARSTRRSRTIALGLEQVLEQFEGWTWDRPARS